MPDTGTLHRLPPRSWPGAFAALPMESPPEDGWNDVSARLAARQRRWPLWLAAAATLALAVGLPLRWTAQQVDSPAVATSIPAAQGPITPPATPAKQGAPALASAEPAQPPPTTPVDIAAKPVPATTTPAGNDQDSGAATRLATVPPMTAPAAVPDPARAELDQLHAESAQLEALLALARDDSVSSASAAVLGEDFEARVGSIDAALMQPSLSDRQRAGLWRERVAALRRLVGFESTQRMLAAHGQRDDALLASVD